MEKLTLINNCFICPGYFYGQLVNNVLTIYTIEHNYEYTIENWYSIDKHIIFDVKGSKKYQTFGIHLHLNRIQPIVFHYEMVPCDIAVSKIETFEKFEKFFKENLSNYEE